MTDQKTSQTQQTPNTGMPNAAAFFPFAGLFEDQLRRWEAMQKEYAALEQKNVEQARLMIDEGAKMLKATLDQSVKVTNEWRKIALETTRQSVGTKA